LKEANSKDWAITSSCQRATLGLTAAHLYTVVGTAEIKHNGIDYKLLKMRNPWGTELYSGPWNDKDPRWTDELKK